MPVLPILAGSGVLLVNTPPVTVPTRASAGAGWAGATDTPAGVGSGRYSTKQAMARADVVPYQTWLTSDTPRLGVVAFHGPASESAQIDRVEASVDDGPWVEVYGASVNPDTSIEEWCFDVDCASIGSGVHEVRFIAYPAKGVPRVIGDAICEGITFTVLADPENDVVCWVDPAGNNATAAVNDKTHPATTIAYALYLCRQANLSGPRGVANCDGATVYLLAGDHAIGADDFGHQVSSLNRWATITRDPDTLRDDCPITTQGSLAMKLVRFLDVKIVIPAWVSGGNISMFIGNGSTTRLWIDRCDITAAGGRYDTHVSMWGGISSYRYITGSYDVPLYWHDMRDGPEDVEIARHVAVDTISADAFSNNRLSLGVRTDTGGSASSTSYMRETFSGLSGDHSDFSQQFNNSGPPMENRIFQGLVANHYILAQGFDAFSAQALKDIAWINCYFSNRNEYGGSIVQDSYSAPTGGISVTGSTKTVSRSDGGSWITDGFLPGDIVYLFQGQNVGTWTVNTVGASDLVLSGAAMVDSTDATGAVAYGFKATASTSKINRAKGSWLDNGITNGSQIRTVGFSNSANNGLFIVVSVTAGDIEVDGVLVNEVANAAQTVILMGGSSGLTAFSFGGATEHLYVRDSVFVGASAWRDDTGFTADECCVENCDFWSEEDGTLYNGGRPAGSETYTADQIEFISTP